MTALYPFPVGGSACLVGSVWSRKKGSQNTQPFNLQLTASAIDNDIYIDHVIFGRLFISIPCSVFSFFRRMNRAAAAFSSARRCNRQRCGADSILTDAILDIFCVPPPAGFTFSPPFSLIRSTFLYRLPVCDRLQPSVIRLGIHLLSRSGRIALCTAVATVEEPRDRKRKRKDERQEEEVHVDAAENGCWSPTPVHGPKNGPMTCANSSIGRRK
jgi:hypothetical protein